MMRSRIAAGLGRPSAYSKRLARPPAAYKQYHPAGCLLVSRHRVASATILTALAMVSLLFKYWVLIGLLASQVVGQYAKPNASFPSLLTATTEELALGLKDKQFTSVDLVSAYVGRILEVNSTLRAVTEINPEAWAIAKQLDKERAVGRVRGPLHGIPILIKNNIATADFMNNTAGSYALLGAKVPRDATVATKLREAGAIILGKANLSQWANFRSGNSSNGWSAHGGQVIGAFLPEQDPCGSSSGSGVASSLGLALATLGSETDGSIICPSQSNNIVGIKPTVGLTSRALVIPISERQDTVGPMARTVKDAAYLLQAIAGPDRYDNYTSAIPFNGTFPDYVAACSVDALEGKRIGLPWQNAGGASPTVLKEYYAALEVLKAGGATIVNVTYTAWDEFEEDAGDSEVNVLWADFKPNLAAYLSQLTVNPNNITSLADARAFTQSFGPEEYPSRNTINFDMSIALNFTNDSPELWAYYQRNQRFGGSGGLLGALERYNLDAVVLPSSVATPISAIIGGPIVTVPLGAYPANTTVTRNRRGNLVAQAPNYPFGISFAGKLWSEEQLIGIAYAFEQRTHYSQKVKPVVVPSTELKDVAGY